MIIWNTAPPTAQYRVRRQIAKADLNTALQRKGHRLPLR